MTFVQSMRGARDSLRAGMLKAPAKYARDIAGGIGALVIVTAISVFMQAQPARTQAAPACPPGQDCPCTWSQWLDRDDPGGVGDFETLVDLVKENKIKCKRPLAVQCRYKGGALWGSQVGSYPPQPTPAGYTCLASGPSAGGICANAKTKPAPTKPNTVTCKDLEVRFCRLPDSDRLRIARV